MKGILITFLVACIHIVIIAVIYYGCHIASDQTGVDDKEGDSAAERDTRRDQEAAEPADEGGKGGEGGGSEAVTTDDDTLSPADFSEDTKPLPDEIKKKVKDCTAGVLVDLDKREIIWKKNPRQAIPIASMVKMMTVLTMMRELEAEPSLSLTTQVKVTENAAAIGGRQVYLDPRESFTLDELLKCVMIFSANDASYLIAEFLGDGDAEAFVKQMNELATAMRLEDAEFISPHGLPDADKENDKASPLDLACMAAELLKYPEVVKYSSTRLDYIRNEDSRFDPFQLLNTNKLVDKVNGVNGMKTGYTKAAGYSITATCKRDDRTLIAVVAGCSSGSKRNALTTDLLEWQFDQQ
ncbi:MAG: D-alanyl-D-alanine carboxypeptidase family protein [Verrucomicrobiota bacterium]